MKILILGGNGFIGSAITQTALTHGHKITCIGRNISTARQRMANCNWLQADISKLTKAEDWMPYLGGIEVIVNAAGALQSSPRDKLQELQQLSMTALYEAAVKIDLQHIVQISANTADTGSQTEFLETKKQADNALKTSGLRHTILRPTLVVGRNAHGGTSLVRAIAGFPYILPVVFGDARCETTDLDDLCEVVLQACLGELGNSGDFAVTSGEIISLEEIMISHRKWLGLSADKIWRLPATLARFGSVFADFAGVLGWRSPLRSTAVAVLSEGVIASPKAERISTKPLNLTLSENPAGVQDIWFTRLYLLKPLILFCLVFFWIVSGSIALWQFDETVRLAASAGLEPVTAKVLTVFTGILDIVLGCLLAFQRFARQAIWGMIIVSLGYLTSGAMLQPELWVDPLGPMFKVLPALMLHLVALSILDER